MKALFKRIAPMSGGWFPPRVAPATLAELVRNRERTGRSHLQVPTSVCRARIATHLALSLSVGGFGCRRFVGHLKVVEAVLDARARRSPLPLRHVRFGVPELHALSQAVGGAGLLLLLGWRGRIGAPGLRPARSLRRLSLRRSRRGDLS